MATPAPAGPTLRAAPARLPVRVDPAFAEAAVWRALHALGTGESDGAAGERLAVHAARAEPRYAIPDGPAREAAFGSLALEEFEDLGLADALRAAVAERPVVAARVAVVLLAEARGRADEGVTWEPGGTHLGIRVDLARYDDPEGLAAWARHVLGHAQDTADPAFGFEPGLAEARLGVPAQARLHRLWDASVDARLPDVSVDARPGGTAADSRSRHRAAIAADLRGAPHAAVDALLDRLCLGPRPTYPELLAWAEDPGTALDAAAGPVARAWPDRCPLCRFPGDDVRPPEPALAALVAAEYPDWRPEHGVCGRCADRYRFTHRLGG